MGIFSYKCIAAMNQSKILDSRKNSAVCLGRQILVLEKHLKFMTDIQI